MTNIDISNLKALCMKYANRGLFVDIEFTRYGMIFRGYWDLTLNKYDIRHFCKEYDYEALQKLSDAITLEFLLDEFKNEFATRLKENEEQA